MLTDLQSYELGFEYGAAAGYAAGRHDAETGRPDRRDAPPAVACVREADPAQYQRGYREAWRESYQDGVLFYEEAAGLVTA